MNITPVLDYSNDSHQKGAEIVNLTRKNNETTIKMNNKVEKSWHLSKSNVLAFLKKNLLGKVISREMLVLTFIIRKNMLACNPVLGS